MTGDPEERARFTLVRTENALCVAPTPLWRAPRRAGRIVGMDAVWTLRAAPARPGLWRERMAVSTRQDLWRRLQRIRGLAPVVRAALIGRDARVEVLLATLDGAPTPPSALDALAEIFHDAALRRRCGWAAARRRR